MLVLLIALLVIWPIAELFVMVQVAMWIGFFWMLLLLFASTVAGILILRHRGRVHWQRFRGAIDERRAPAREAFDGTMITLGAVLLIIPGFITSLLGLFLLFPPTRYLVRLAGFALFASRYRMVATGGAWGNRAWGTWRSRRSTWDIDGEAVEVTVETTEIETGPGPTARAEATPPPPSLPPAGGSDDGR
jgi:UPF0716 protein FxsA